MARLRDRGAGLTGELVREGDYWSVAFDQHQLRVRDSKGMGYLAELLGRPDLEISALELTGGTSEHRTPPRQTTQEGLASGGEADLGPTLDAKAKAAYRRRLEELRAELDEAEDFHDPERAARAREEYEFVANELTSAVGLGGRDRRAGSPAERARLNVTRAIKTAVERLAEHDPALGEYLSTTVLTGRACVYRPDRGPAVDWRIIGRAPRAALPRRFEPPDVNYVWLGDLSIAYQTLGDGPVDIVFTTGWLSHLDFQWTDPTFTLLLRNLAEFSRVITFDRRGAGLSDPISHTPSLDERIDDVRAVLDGARSERAVLFGLYEGAAILAAFAAAYPERVLALVLYGPFPAGPAVGGFPGVAELGEMGARMRAAAETAWGRGGTLEVLAPELGTNRVMRRMWGMFERASMSPAVARAQLDWIDQLDIRPALPVIQAPTLVMHCTGDVVPIASGRYVAAQIPGARFLELPGDWHAPLTGDMDQLTDAIEEFVDSQQLDREPASVLATILVVDAPEELAQTVRDGVAAAGGIALPATGGCVTARFAGPARAVRCAQTILEDARLRGSAARAAVHAGECQFGAKGLSGSAISIATALAARAAPAEILITGTVRDLLVDSGTELEARAIEQIPGVPGEWPTLAVIAIPDQPSLTATAEGEPPLVDRAARHLARHAPGAARATLRLVKGKG